MKINENGIIREMTDAQLEALHDMPEQETVPTQDEYAEAAKILLGGEVNDHY